MKIYDLDNIEYLKIDINQTLEKIKDLFELNFDNEKIEVVSKLVVDEKYKWFSDECQIAFNEKIPILKSIHKDMYAIIETIIKNKTNSFDINAFENKYEYFKEFRLFNNKIKHFNNQNAEITLTAIVLNESIGNRIDYYCNFNYNDSFNALFFTEFIKLFIKLLVDFDIIKIN